MYFMNSKGIVYSIDEDGCTNAPFRIDIHEDLVYEIQNVNGEDCLLFTYTLYDTLMELAKDYEG